MPIYETLEALQIPLSTLPTPVGAYIPFVRSGNLLFLSGHIAKKDGKPWRGKVGEDLSLADGVEAARSVAKDLINTLHAATGDLAQIQRIVKLMVLVNSTPTFTDQHLVANGASELFSQVFAEKGPHARSAFGVTQIPLGSCVEVELVAELSPRP